MESNYEIFSTSQLQKWLVEAEQDEDFEDCKAIKEELDAREKGEKRKLIFAAQMQAIDQTDNILKTYQIARIKAYTVEEAIEFCRSNAPYLKVIGQILAEISMDVDDDDLIEFIE